MPCNILAGPRHCGRGHGCRGSPDRGAGGSFLFQHGPVKGVVILVVEGAEQDAEQLPEIHVVRSLLEPQASAVVKIHGELGGKTLGKKEDLVRSRTDSKLKTVILPCRAPQQALTFSFH